MVVFRFLVSVDSIHDFSQLIECVKLLLFRCDAGDLQDHAAWLLANIACENCVCVLDAGVLPPLLRLLDEFKLETPSQQSLMKTGTWLLSNLCQVGSTVIVSGIWVMCFA